MKVLLLVGASAHGAHEDFLCGRTSMSDNPQTAAISTNLSLPKNLHQPHLTR